ncbi:copper-binding protein [Alkalilimnicola ehrlichii MLHE-1]|uniref:Copper-binding protein n=1 Tax=Alkalilimnicola ehrlichii (strain ATCC BAA-1101 / DSM 17681 / MLHE-1) TaxID=187272 RepID=Q0A9Q3_ALKEH|nr:copper-binding protein [Alkalilimnicola ehrlichii]ABI56434.1 hypothetical protein Mlg_1082 [Alkalilimnicola ehrlichii MLHE-1]
MKSYSLPLVVTLALLVWSVAGLAQDVERSEVYPVNGIFVSYDEADHEIVVIHEEVPQVMRAMRMMLRLPEGEPAPQFTHGDKIRFGMQRRAVQGHQWFAMDLEPLPEETALVLPEKALEREGLK